MRQAAKLAAMILRSLMRGLALETSGRIGSVAAVADGVVVAEETFAHGLQHAAQIVPILDRLTRAQGWTPRDVQELYVSAGPGSFTGLRIAVTLAKTMALATGVKLVAVPTVRVLVENAPPDARHAIIVLDAKRDQIFTARFERVGNEWIEREPAKLDSLTAMLERSPRPVHLIGEGIPYHEKVIPRDDASVIVTSPDLARARAGVVATIGHTRARRGEFADAQRLAPIYLRRPEAEEKFESLKK
jgi:tRNA threonylcarbamoyladenosine biosynthesis protein TsaB